LNRQDLIQTLHAASRQIGGVQGFKNRYRPYVCPLLEILEQIPEGSRLFDVGCGSGTLLYLGRCFRSLEKATGYDVSSPAVEASKVFGGIDVQWRSPDAPPPSFAGYDIVTMIDVLHHIHPQKQQQFVDDIVRNMDVGCSLIIADIDAARRVGAFLNQFHDLLLAREWVHPWPVEKVLAVLDDAGCRKTHLSLHRTLWYPHFIIKAEKVAAT